MKIELPGRPGEAILVDNHGEHHMSSWTYEFQLPFDVEGVRCFFTTNGDIHISLDEQYVYVRDSLVVLQIKIADATVRHFVPAKGKYIGGLEEEEKHWRIRYYNRSGSYDWKRVRKKKIVFESGMGPVKDGLLPSAWEPVVKSILAERAEK